MEWVFWLSLLFIGYTYLGYPIVLALLALRKHRPVFKRDVAPTVSLIITAYNEEQRIGSKIENALAQDYHREGLEVIVASDCSTDETDTIVERYRTEGVKLVRLEQRGGKEAAQGMAMRIAKGEIIVFSDASTILSRDGVSRIVRNFNDPTVGCVSSVDCMITPSGEGSGEALYVSYEMFLRRLESAAGSIVGVSGSFFAARREVCSNWATDEQSDFRIVLSTVSMGLRAVLDAQSIGSYRNIRDEQKEYARKVRTVVRGLTVLMNNRHMLNPAKYGLFAWQLWSHKVCRWLIPFGMCLAVVSNGLVALQSRLYAATFLAQVALYVVGAIGLNRKTRPLKILIPPAFLVMANLAIATAWYRYLRGERVVAWQSSDR